MNLHDVVVRLLGDPVQSVIVSSKHDLLAQLHEISIRQHVAMRMKCLLF